MQLYMYTKTVMEALCLNKRMEIVIFAVSNALFSGTSKIRILINAILKLEGLVKITDFKAF